MADLTPDLHICLWGSIAKSFHLAIPLCQLFPCHLGPPRPSLSINLYVKGRLDCTTGAVHMSIPVEPSLLQNKVITALPQVAHWIWWWQCLAAWHCRSVWSLPYHFAADVGGLALSMAKSHWHGALRIALYPQGLYTCLEREVAAEKSIYSNYTGRPVQTVLTQM